MDRTERTDEKRARFLAQLADGQSIGAACKAGGFVRDTAYRWRKEDPAFAAEWDAAIEQGTDELEDVAIKRARDGSDTLLIFMLKARRKETYADLGVRRITGRDDDSPVRLSLEDGRRTVQDFMLEFVTDEAVDD